ncbi:sigma-54 interaction domain-containing protein [Paenibacillus guangzhouensis]|uniref:sigma-54 interaction domain-containing protein n=1 Tax=Paenibacillus guangzhouensis TaxID=1473112 RepID=UPI0012676F43|nr:sigma 54-interacting transcriptional regulator [Paenibacillus guangzhouensis]
MKHHLPCLESLIHTSFICISADHSESQPIQPIAQQDGGPVFMQAGSQYYYVAASHELRDGALEPSFVKLPVEALPVNMPLEEAITRFNCSAYLLVESEDQVIGYVSAAEVLQSVMRSYRILDAYYQTTLATIDPDMAITLINEAQEVAVWTAGAEQIFSIQSQEIIGKPATSFFPVDRLQSLKTLQTGESVYKMQHQPRQDLFVLINANPVKLDGEIIGAVAAESDITAQIRLHQEMLHMSSKMHHLQREMEMLSPSPDPFSPIKGTSRTIKSCIDTMRKVSQTKATVLIQGESGTGKELFAKAIHDSREDQDAPFIAINCGAIPPALFESELFGYEKGAFSGADPRGKKGQIALANGGTLFLDEIGEMPLEMQVKLLRVLQEKKYFPIGGTQMRSADCRIIAATNRDLKKMIADGKFREDLYYRLNVLSMEIPPLRQRKEDIYDLTQSFLHEFSLVYGRHIQDIPPEVIRYLVQYDWPGNIRELRNTIERLVIFATDGMIKTDYLPSALYQETARPAEASSSAPMDRHLGVHAYQETMDAFERNLLQQALEEVQGNKLEMAKLLGVSRATLYNKLKRFGL